MATTDGNTNAPELLDELVLEYIDRLNTGEALNRTEIHDSHPEIATELLERLETFIDLGSADDPDEPNEPLGSLGDYTLKRQIGRGGMGVVYEAWENSMDRQVALKVLPHAVAADTRAVTRFVREAQVAGKLQHANVVNVYGMGLKEQTPYYAMEYVEGKTLAQVLGTIKDRHAESEVETPFGTRDDVAYFANLARAFADVADGLQHAHSMGVVHRDMKPSNLILDSEGRLRILDFGLAHLEGQESLTLSGDVIGTPSYMSPEQARAQKDPIDHRTDVYSLGATMYEALTLKPPFKGKSHQDTLSQILESDPEEPRRSNPRIPSDLETVVLKCLRKDATDRYGTAEALAQDLRRFVRGDAIEARPESAFEKLGRRFTRYRAVVVTTVIALLFVVAGLAAANVMIAREREQAKYDLYTSNMRLAVDDWRSGNLRRFERTLEEHIPGPGETDLRGWEWYFLRSIRRAEVFTLEGHAAPVRSVVWSPDGETLASGAEDGRVFLWSAETGERLASVSSGDGAVWTLAFAPGGLRLASAGDDGQVKLWSVPLMAEFGSLPRKERSCVTSLAWSRDGKWLAVAGKFSTVEVWSVETSERIAQLPTQWSGNRRVQVDWSADSERLAALSLWPSQFVVWRSTGWEEISRSEIGRWSSYSISFSPDGSSLAVCGADSRIRIFSAETANERSSLPAHEGLVTSVAWSPTGDRVASAGTDSLVKIHDPSRDTRPLILRGHDEWVWSLSWSPDGSRLASASIDGTVRIWQAESEASALMPGGTHPAAFSPDGRWVASRSDSDESLHIFDVDTGELVENVPGEKIDVISLAFSPDSQLLARGGHGGVEVWNWQESARIHGPTGGSSAHDVDWSADGVFLAQVSGREVIIWDAVRKEDVKKLPAQETEVRSIDWSPDARLLATSTRGGTVRVWDTQTWAKRFAFEKGDSAQILAGGNHNGLTFSHDGLELIAATEKGEIVIWDLVTGEELVRTRGHTAHAKCVALSPDGTRLATSGSERQLKIWDASRSGELRELMTLEDESLFYIYSLAWHPDGRRLLSAGPEQNSLRIWDATPSYEKEASEDR